MFRMLLMACTVAFSLSLASDADARTGAWLQSFAERPYSRVRSELIGIGYRPVRFAAGSKGDRCYGVSWCDLYPETENCSGTGLALCSFIFYHRKSKKYLSVVTYGETRLIVLRAYYLTRNDRIGWHPYVL